MGIFTDARQKKADRYNAARQRVVEDFLSQNYYSKKASRDLITRVSTETAEEYQIRLENYREVMIPLREKTKFLADDSRKKYQRSPETPLYLLTAKLLDWEAEYLTVCLRIVEEHLLRVEDAAYYANRLGFAVHEVRADWMKKLARTSGLPDEVRDYIKRLS